MPIIKSGYIFIPHLADKPAREVTKFTPGTLDAQFNGKWGHFYAIDSDVVEGCRLVPHSEYLSAR